VTETHGPISTISFGLELSADFFKSHMHVPFPI